MIELSVIGQEGLASLRTAADYAVTLPVPALLALALPCLAAFLAQVLAPSSSRFCSLSLP